MSRKLVSRTLSRCISTPLLSCRLRLSPTVWPSRVAATPLRWASSSPPANAPGAGLEGPPGLVVEMTDGALPAVKLTRTATNQQCHLPLQRLRDACQCSHCVDPHSGQKTFGTTDVPAEQPVQSCIIEDDGTLVVAWEKDSLSGGQSHESRYSPETIRQWLSGQPSSLMSRRPIPTPTLWDKDILAQSRPTVEYDDWVSSDDGFHAALAQLSSYGFLIVDGVPKSEDSVTTIARRIGNVMETFYGRTWDVRSKPQAENVAYTNSFLGLHQDLLYLREPPRIQFLHCLENTCDGGESIFSDSLRAVTHMNVHNPEDAKILKSFKVVYHYEKNGYFYERALPVFSDKNVRWSPPFQASDQRWPTTEAGMQGYRRWFHAVTALRHLLEDDPWVYEHKLKPGQCVVFDNHRVLHGRRRFDTASGTRWLKGTYVATDEWDSKRRAVHEQLRAITGDGIEPLIHQIDKLIHS